MSKPSDRLYFGKTNIAIMLAGIGLIFLGFVCMAIDSEPYGFGTLGLTVGPILTFLGFVIEFVAIMYTPRVREQKNTN